MLESSSKKNGGMRMNLKIKTGITIIDAVQLNIFIFREIAKCIQVHIFKELIIFLVYTNI